MTYRFATDADLPLLARWNHALIRDEGHRNGMSISELETRMRGWLASEYRAVIFERDAAPIAYALFRESEAGTYLRQFYVAPEARRQGVGREAVHILRRLFSLTSAFTFAPSLFSTFEPSPTRSGFIVDVDNTMR